MIRLLCNIRKEKIMKKKILLAGIIIVLLILLVPIPFKMKDGGTVEYRALLYTVTNYHRTTLEGYQDGLKIEVLGFVIFNNFE